MLFLLQFLLIRPAVQVTSQPCYVRFASACVLLPLVNSESGCPGLSLATARVHGVSSCSLLIVSVNAWQVLLPYLRAKLDGLYTRHAHSHEALPGLGAFQRR